MMNTYRNNRERATERARAITAAKKESARKKRIIISSAALALVIITAASFVFMGFADNNAKTAADTTVSKSVLAAQAENQPATDAVQQATAAPEAVQSSWIAEESESSGYIAPVQQIFTPAEGEQKDEDRIDVVDGERIYIDTKRTAPEGSGTPLHFYANGKTSYGFDWNYDADNCNFVLRCDYNFDQQQYDFQFYGVTPGTANVTVYYNIDDNTQVPVSLTIFVDDALNVSQL